MVREASRKILVDIEFTPPNRIEISRGRLMYNGVEVLVRPDRIELGQGNVTIKDNSALNCNCGISIGPHNVPSGGFFVLEKISRYPTPSPRSNTWVTEVFDKSAQ